MKIQLPTPGRVVLYAWANDLDAVRATASTNLVSELAVIPAMVIAHRGEGKVLLAPIGASTVFDHVPYGVGDDGQPAQSCWCYPPMVRSEVEVPDPA